MLFYLIRIKENQEKFVNKFFFYFLSVDVFLGLPRISFIASHFWPQNTADNIALLKWSLLKNEFSSEIRNLYLPFFETPLSISVWAICNKNWLYVHILLSTLHYHTYDVNIV